MSVISDKGYVCDVQVLRGIDEETDKKAARAVRKWHFEPARKGGHAVPVVVTVEVHYWRKDGELVQFPAEPTTTQTQGDSVHDR
jgi:TonB family protein